MIAKYSKIFRYATVFAAALMVPGAVMASEIFEKADHRLCVAVAKYADQVFNKDWPSHIAGKIIFDTHVARIDGSSEAEDPLSYEVATSVDYKLVDQFKNRDEFVKQFNKCITEARAETDEARKQRRAVYKHAVWKRWRGNNYLVFTSE